jgi:hypothetical protein
MVKDGRAKKKPSRKSTNKERLLIYFEKLRQIWYFKLFLLTLISFLVLESSFLTAAFANYNYLEIFPSDFIFPTFMNLSTAFLIALVIYFIPLIRGFSAKMVATLVLSLAITGYDGNLQSVSGVIRAFIPGLTVDDSIQTVSIIYLLVLTALAALIGIGFSALQKRIEALRGNNAGLGILIIILFLSFPSFLSLFAILPTITRESHVQAPELAETGQSADASSKPDIYYIVLDRYTNNNILKDQFSYDNGAFTDFLKGNNFTVNESAYSNYPYTTMSISSAVSAGYTNKLVEPYKNNEIQSKTLYHNLIRQSSVIKALKQKGYEYDSIGSGYGATNKAPLADHDYMADYIIKIFGKEKRLRGIEGSEFAKSPYYRFALSAPKWFPVKIFERDRISYIRDQLGVLDNLAGKKPGGRFIMAHILVPHDPFNFNADSSLSANFGVDNVGEPIKQKYIGQVEFINSQMKDIVSKIQAKSGGQSVIAFNSDEGPYPQYLNSSFGRPPPQDQPAVDAIFNGKEDMRGWSDDWLKMKFGILQAVHIPNATSQDLDNLSSVNLFRIILNRYAGYSLDYLPECHFGVTNGKNEYNYADISKKLGKAPPAQCKILESHP